MGKGWENDEARKIDGKGWENDGKRLENDEKRLGK